MVHVHLTFRTDLVSLERAQSVVDNFAHVLNTVVIRLSTARLNIDELMVRDIDTTSRSDYNRIVKFSAPITLKLDDCVHELIFTRCTKPEHADKQAVAAWDGSFTYAELFQHAMRLAGAIVDAANRVQQDGRNDPLFVPFYLTKSKWYVCLLACLAA